MSDAHAYGLKGRLDGLVAPPADTPGPVIFEVLSGSRAYGTAGPDSDDDWRGVFLLPNHVFLGLDRAETTWEHKGSDQVFWELGHFCRLLLKGNPNIVSMLSTPSACVVLEEPPLAGLRDMAPRLVTQSLRAAYMGWVFDEMRRVQKMEHGPAGRARGDGKRLSHVARLVYEFRHALTDGLLPVRLEGDELEFVLDVKFSRTDRTYQEAFDAIAQMTLDLEALDEELGPSLPEAPTEEMRAWLVAAREKFGVFGTLIFDPLASNRDSR